MLEGFWITLNWKPRKSDEEEFLFGGNRYEGAFQKFRTSINKNGTENERWRRQSATVEEELENNHREENSWVNITKKKFCAQ